ncbi:MAG: 30S ribosomal protein S3 [Planctomycetes bacterium]|nr:30S ribosomal protein S3 [Planctomycetota bacterium]
MGQKVNPTSFRLGITETWRSRWYAPKKEYGKNVVEDEKIRKFIKRDYRFVGISRIDIERNKDKTIVQIHAARPGLIIGRKGATIEKLTTDLTKLSVRPVDIKIIEVTNPELNSQLIAESIVEQLEKRAPYRRTIRRAAETVMAANAKGVKVQVAGRLGGAEIARTEDLSMGKIPLNTIRADIDYAISTAILTKGTIGVKVWIYKGEVFPEKKPVIEKTEKKV